jgi:hypothetical protein
MTHDQIDRMVRRANPLPDPNVLTPVDAPVLTTERRMEMQTDDRPETEVQADRNGWRGPLIGIAAAVAVLVAGSIFLLTNDDTPVATPAPNAIPIPTGEDDPLVPPGAYFVDTDGDEATTARGTFVIEGVDWSGLDPGAAKFGEEDESYVSLMVTEVDEVYESPCVTSGRGPVAAGTTAEDLANQFAVAGFTVQEAVSPVSAFGQNGYHLVVEVPAGCTGDLAAIWEGPTWGTRFYQAEGQVEEYWFLDVDGTPVMVEASHFPDSAEEDVAELRAVLDTLVITP